MTFTILAPARLHSSTTIFTLLRNYLARAAASPEVSDAADLPPRLRYDVGLSDLSPDRLARGMMRDNF